MANIPVLVNTRDFGYVSIPPKFEPQDFGSWKERMLLHIVGVEPYLMTILTTGPYVPKAIAYVPAAVADGEPIQETIDKPREQ